MTPLYLQEALVKDLREIFKDDRFENTLGERVEMNVFEQQLPVLQSEEDPDPVPYSLVRLETGKTEGDEAQEISVTILFGLINQNPVNDGHKDVLNVIQKVYERYMKNPMLANQFMFQDPFNWALQDEESFPYFFGAASLTFRASAIRKEDKFA